MSAEGLFFTGFALAACLGAIAVIISQSVVRMAFWLIISLGSTAGLFFWRTPISSEPPSC